MVPCKRTQHVASVCIGLLSDRSQRVKLGNDCLSEWGRVPSGVPNGTKLGPWLFLLMINDLSIPDIFNMWKYVDDAAVSETIQKGKQSKAQQVVDHISEWSKKSLFQLNCEKTKELIISFIRSYQLQFPEAFVDGNPITQTTSAKLLAVTISSNLAWNDHIEELVKKSSRKLYFLVQLKRTQITPAKDLVAYYCACIRSLLDYACPVFHHSLTKYIQTDLERVQKRALACIFPGKPYDEVLSVAGLVSIREHHSAITKKLFQLIADNPGNKLHHLLPNENCQTRYNLRRPRRFTLPLAKTKSFADSFIIQYSNDAMYQENMRGQRRKLPVMGL